MRPAVPLRLTPSGQTAEIVQSIHRTGLQPVAQVGGPTRLPSIHCAVRYEGASIVEMLVVARQCSLQPGHIGADGKMSKS